MTTEQLIAEIEGIQTSEDVKRVTDLIWAEPGKMDPAVQKALTKRLADATAITEQIVRDAKTILAENGVSYPLSDWLTPTNYAKRFGLENRAIVTNWIARGIIPADCIKEIPELNLRLVKAVEYQPRTYSKVA